MGPTLGVFLLLLHLTLGFEPLSIVAADTLCFPFSYKFYFISPLVQHFSKHILLSRMLLKHQLVFVVGSLHVLSLQIHRVYPFIHNISAFSTMNKMWFPYAALFQSSESLTPSPPWVFGQQMFSQATEWIFLFSSRGTPINLCISFNISTYCFTKNKTGPLHKSMFIETVMTSKNLPA